MARGEEFKFRPDFKDAGSKSQEGDDAVWTWFSPPDEADSRHKYAVIKEEDGLLQIQPGEGRFKKGLKAVRYKSEDSKTGKTWLVLKTRPNRIDLKRADG